jgi:phosphohistidine phosphatase SixA
MPLTPLGIREIESVSRQLVEKLAAHPPVTYVLASPHCAAMETARRVMEVLAIPGAPVSEDALDPDLGNPRDPRAIAAIVDGLVASDSEILIVGHQPLLGELGRSWTGHRVSPVRAGVACIEWRRSEARLLWMLEP